jgi:RNA polymerase sigma-70 factor (ECF subfamily)
MRHSIPIPVEVAQQVAAMAQTPPLTERIGEAAFSRLYNETGPKLRDYVRRAARDAALGDDVFQETFLRFLRVCPAGLDERQQRSYLYRIAASLLMDHWRRVKRERMWSLLTPWKEAAADRTGIGPDMRRGFQQLKPQEQALLWLAYIEGFDHREIAEALELREKSVRVLLFRARKGLASNLRELGLGPHEQSEPRPQGSGS